MKKGFETPFFPKVIKQNSAGHCVKGTAWPTLGFDIGTEWVKSLWGYMFNLSIYHIVISLACYSYFKAVRLGEFKSMENINLNGEVTP